MTQKVRYKNLEDFGYGPNVMRNTKVCGICAEADEQMPSAVVGRIIKDGTNFILKATVNEGKEIYATGSQRFPRHYGDFGDACRRTAFVIALTAVSLFSLLLR